MGDYAYLRKERKAFPSKKAGVGTKEAERGGGGGGGGGPQQNDDENSADGDNEQGRQNMSFLSEPRRHSRTRARASASCPPPRPRGSTPEQPEKTGASGCAS